jgi:hypothetical protein
MRRDRSSVLTFRQARIAKAASTRFGVINGAALHAGLYHRLVFALRTVPEDEPRGERIVYRARQTASQEFAQICELSLIVHGSIDFHQGWTARTKVLAALLQFAAKLERI